MPVAPPLRPRWRASALVRASFVTHAAGAILAVVRPSLWPWIVSAVVADHALLTAAGLWPRSRLLGPNWVRLPAAAIAQRQIAITIDDGPDPAVTPQLLDILERFGAHASFFCIGERVAAHPELARDIIRRGHTVENHSLQHLHHFSLLGPRAMRAEVERAQQLISATVGELPRFFRAPAGLRNPFLDQILASLGLQLASWTRRGFDTVTREPDRVLARLVRGLGSGDIVLLHDGHAARTVSGVPVAVEVLPRLLDAAVAARLTPVTLRATL
jgi:peptidoglycan/xylan/chitin deacetylase (PgdA/CDA1 family)